MHPVFRSLAGAAIGGLIGCLVFLWATRQGFYAMILPGALIGFGARWGKPVSVAIPILCGLAALGLGLYCEWRAFPFRANNSPDYFVRHLHQLRPMTWIMIVLGAALAFWLPWRRRL